MLLFIFGFIAISIAAYYLLRDPLKIWLPVQAEILSYEEKIGNEVLVAGHAAAKVYYPKVLYEYEYRGTRYECNRVALNRRDIFVSIEEQDRPWQDWHVGKMVQVYIHPKKPHHAVMLKQMAPGRKAQYMQLIISAYVTLFMFLFVYMFVEL